MKKKSLIATVKKKTISKEMIFTNPYTFLCAGHDFGENGMGMIFPPNLLPSTTGFYFTYIPIWLVHVYT